MHDPPITGLVDAGVLRPEDFSSREGVSSEVDVSKTGILPALTSGGRKPKRKSGKINFVLEYIHRSF